jgi:hypothetical protein
MLRVPRVDGAGYEPGVFRSAAGEQVFALGCTYWLPDPGNVGVHSRGFHAHAALTDCFVHDWGFTASNSVVAEVLLHGGNVLYDSASATYVAPAVTILRLVAS